MSKAISWDDQQAFFAVLEEGSLSGAARLLGVSHATARSRIEALETSLGAVLFTRSVNGLAPTEHARALQDAARAMALASRRFVREASAPPGTIAGVVRLSVPEVMGVEVVPPMLKALRDTHPAIQIELSLSNAPADLLAQEVDIAVRTVEPRQSSLVARRVARIPLGLFAALSYLEKHRAPGTLADLSCHHLIGPDRDRTDLAFVDALDPVFAEAAYVLRTDSHPAQIAAARAGIGVALVQVPLGERDPLLTRLLPDFVAARLDTWLVTHENLRHVPKVRTVLDALAVAFQHFGAPSADSPPA